jgi:UDP-N-acetylglucosamine--N-acetylmuramyl-(pentapeptide) pyrophosphoryl-undecaprenol N-acetylglucosamine transferase
VVATGGYVSGPVVLAARLLGIPSLALEGNRTPGWTSRIVAHLVDAVAVAHPEMREFFSRRLRAGAEAYLTGLPLREEIATLDRSEGARAVGLDPSLTTLLVLGGSLGSQRINEALLDAFDEMRTQRVPTDELQVLHVTGERYFASGEKDRDLPPRYRSLPYLDENYANALAAADIVVSRAGAGTVAEITARGVAAILIPWSQATTGEQALNAEPLAGAGAAVVIADRDLTPDRLATALAELLQSDEKRSQMAAASRRLGRPHAAERVAELALGLARQSFRA